MAELEYSGTYEAALATSRKIEEDIVKNPQKYRVLTLPILNEPSSRGYDY